MIIEAIAQLIKGEDLQYSQTVDVFNEIIEGKATHAQIAAFLTALRIKGETSEEITAATTVMKSKCLDVDLGDAQVIDIVGTGGDGADTFNISSVTSFVVAAAGVAVAKHGGRSASGKTGSADCLEALGVNIYTDPKQEIEVFNKTNMCYMFAQNHHPAMKFVAPVRTEIKFRTLFNILGPLINPAKAPMQILGVFSEDLVDIIATAMINLGIKNGMVIHGADGLDEATVCDETIIAEIKDGVLVSYTITPEEFGLGRYDSSELKSENLLENVRIAKEIFSGKLNGAKKDVVVLNSALALYVAKKVDSIQSGVELAQEIISSGKAQQKLEDFITATNAIK